jgi:hypothetical protein
MKPQARAHEVAGNSHQQHPSQRDRVGKRFFATAEDGVRPGRTAADRRAPVWPARSVARKRTWPPPEHLPGPLLLSNLRYARGGGGRYRLHVRCGCRC